jgi:hypothetical protein
MAPGSEFRDRMRRALFALALIAMLFRGAVAPGMMLAPAPDRTLAITLCGGGEALFNLSTGALEPHHGAPPSKREGHAPCVFAAAAAHVAPAPLATSLDLPRLEPDRAPPPRAPTRIGEGLAAPPPPSTGPPALLS